MHSRVVNNSKYRDHVTCAESSIKFPVFADVHGVLMRGKLSSNKVISRGGAGAKSGPGSNTRQTLTTQVRHHVCTRTETGTYN